MYLTAQEVQRRSDGEREIHAFLHLHDTEACPFPEAMADVPLKAPGRLVVSRPEHPRVEFGGNDVLSYMDIVVNDLLWSAFWFDRLAGIRAKIERDALVRSEWSLGPFYVAFSVHATEPPAVAFDALVVHLSGLTSQASALSEAAWREHRSRREAPPVRSRRAAG
jgi:hypothetical protein